jgi:hypothetical protein
MKIQRFTKKPLTVEAMRIDTLSAAEEAARWVRSEKGSMTVRADRTNYGGFEAMLETPEGRAILDGSYWIIKGIDGNFYACEQDSFTALYDPAEEQQSAATEGSA